MRILGTSLALLNLLLWFCVPAIRAWVDETTGRWSDPNNPRILTGVQELFVYFDPWLARGIFPIVYIFGFMAVPFLLGPSQQRDGPPPGHANAVVVSLLLIGFEIVWLMLIAVGVLLRGPNWNVFWPGEQWDEYKVVPLNNVNLSDFFWYSVGLSPAGMSWELRELPGLTLMVIYFLMGILLAYGLFRLRLRTTSYWRWLALVLVFQIAAFVPLKMFCRYMFNVKYWIYVPEHFWNV